jgi:hypothetical protein
LKNPIPKSENAEQQTHLYGRKAEFRHNILGRNGDVYSIDASNDADAKKHEQDDPPCFRRAAFNHG